ncbi:hypothetical protein ACOBV8_20210 (plasmid) [Pseudoalteromonas espejiana]
MVVLADNYPSAIKAVDALKVTLQKGPNGQRYWLDIQALGAKTM